VWIHRLDYIYIYLFIYFIYFFKFFFFEAEMKVKMKQSVSEKTVGGESNNEYFPLVNHNRVY